MKKITPYLLIVTVIIVGYFVNAEILKQYKQSEGTESKSVIGKDISISDQLKTILVYPKKKNLIEF